MGVPHWPAENRVSPGLDFATAGKCKPSLGPFQSVDSVMIYGLGKLHWTVIPTALIIVSFVIMDTSTQFAIFVEFNG